MGASPIMRAGDETARDEASAFTIRDERLADHRAVSALIAEAFAPMPFSDGTEATLPAALRAAGAVTLALVAEQMGVVVGHVLFSPARVGGHPSAWHTLGPIAVAPGLQRRGIGSRLILDGLRQLRATGAAGCIVEGDPGYYRRFGFEPAPALAPAEASAEFFMALSFGGDLPAARFGYHPAFGDPSP